MLETSCSENAENNQRMISYFSDVVASPKVEPKEEVDLRKHGVYQCCNNCLQTYGALSQPPTRECHRCHKPWIKTFAYKEESTGTWAKVRPKPAYSKGPFNPCTRNNHTIDCPSPHSRQELALWSSFCGKLLDFL